MSGALLASLPLLPALAGGALLLRPPGAERAAAPVAVLSALAAVALAALALAAPAEAGLRWFPGLGLGLDSTGVNGVFALLVASIGLAVFLYSARFMGPEEARARFFGFMALFLGAMLGLVLARDLATLLVAWELVGLCSWALIGYWHAEADRTRDAMRAFLTTRFADLGLYVAAMAAFAGGTLALAELPALPAPLRDVAAAGIVVAALCKSAQLPFSGWLRGAMSGPAPVSALLHSATMVAAGAVLLIKVMGLVEAVGWAGPLVLWIGVATVLTGALVALAEDDLKRLLAASTVSQYGYVFAGIGALGSAAASAHLVDHAAYKALLFMGAGVLILNGYHALSEMRGLRRGNPVLAALFLAGALSLAALPPFGGYLSKDALLGSVLHASAIAFWLLIAGAVLTAWYAGRAWLGAFAGRGGHGGPRRTVLLVPIAVLAVASLALGLLVLPPLEEWWNRLFPAHELPPLRAWELAVSALAALLGLGLAAAEHQGRLRLPAALSPAALDWFGLPDLIDRTGRAGIGAAGAVGAAGARLPGPERAGPLTLAAARTVAGRSPPGPERAGPLALAAARAVAGRSSPGPDRAGPLTLAVARAAAGRSRPGVEPVLDRGARGAGLGSVGAALRSARVDRQVIDGAIARLDATLAAGSGLLSRVQTGLLHRYYAGAAAGSAALLLLSLVLLVTG